MRTAGIRAGDIVLCDVRGHRFYALVKERAESELAITPLDRHVTYYSVRAREVVDHFRKSRARQEAAA